MSVVLHNRLNGEAGSMARFVRITPMKARRVLNVIRNKNVSKAKEELKFMPQAAAKTVLQVLNSALINAKETVEGNNKNMNDEDFVVSRAYADEAPTMKRFKARARGQGSRINKRTSHITIAVALSSDAQVKVSENVKDAKKDSKADSKKTSIAKKTAAKDEKKDNAKKTVTKNVSKTSVAKTNNSKATKTNKMNVKNTKTNFNPRKSGGNR